MSRYLTKEGAQEWFKNAASDSFSDILYYDRKECEEVDRDTLAQMIEKGFLDRDFVIKVYMDLIEENL